MRTLAMLLLSLSLIGTLQAQKSPQAAFDEANISLENASYGAALRQYKAIEQQGNVSGALFLNMGIAATQVDSLGLAKYYLLKASRFEEVEEAAERALEYVNSQFSRQSATLPKLPWDRAVDWLKAGPGAGGVLYLGIGIGFLGMLLVVTKWFGLLHFSKQNPVIAGLSVVSLLIVILAFYVDYVDRRYEEAILVDQEERVLERPDPDAPLVSMAYEGYALTLDHRESDRVEDWYYIRLGNGQYGWIQTKGIRVL